MISSCIHNRNDISLRWRVHRRLKIYANPITEYIEILPITWYIESVEFDAILQIGDDRMFIEERHREISDYIRENGKIMVSEITGKYGISDESARRDLRILEQKGHCQRTHGGAIAVRQVGLRPPADRCFESMPIFENYRQIAAHASGLIRENDSVFLTGGSFGYIMTSLLPREYHYTVVVNSADIAKELRSYDNIDVYLTGGRMSPRGSFYDSMAREMVGRMHFDLCFLTGAGLTADFGLSNATDEAASFQRTVIQNSRRRYLLMPGTKIGVNAFIRVCDAEVFDAVITDGDCVDERIAALKERKIDVIVTGERK